MEFLLRELTRQFIINLLISLPIALCAALFGLVCLDREWFYRLTFLSGEHEEPDILSINRKWRFFIAVFVFIGTVLASLKILFSDIGWIHTAKLEIGLVVMSGAAAVDLREHRIPNMFPAVLALAGMAALTAGFFSAQEGSVTYVASSVIASVITVCGLLLVRIMSRDGIGMGDIKLFGALAILGGVYLVCGTLFFSVILSAVVAVFLLVVQKAEKSTGIAFGPFIYLGFLFSVYSSLF